MASVPPSTNTTLPQQKADHGRNLLGRAEAPQWDFEVADGVAVSRMIEAGLEHRSHGGARGDGV
jgi:hypothetical protein